MTSNSGNRKDQQDITYQIVFRESSDPKMIIDRDGMILDVNNAWARLFGKNPQACLGLNAFRLIDANADDNNERKKKVDEACRTGKQVHIDDEWQGKHFRNWFYPVRGKDGVIDRLYVCSQEITDIKLAESRSRKQSAFNREAMESIPGPFVVHDNLGAVVSCNSHFRNLIARNDGDDLKGINSLDLFHPDDREIAYEKLDDIIQKGTEETADLRILINGGPEFRWFRISTKRFFVDDEMFLVSFGTDIEKYKDTEKELLIGNEQLRFILSESGTGSWEWDLKTGINKWSDAVWELYGISKNSCTPSCECWKQAIIEEDRHRIMGEIANATKKALPFRLQWRTRHADGSLHWLFSKGIPIRQSDGKLSHYLGFVEDITDLKRAEMQLEESEERFRKLFEDHSSVMLVIDVETNRIINANRAATRFYGWSVREICQMDIGKMSTRSTDYLNKEKNALSTGISIKFSDIHKTADGSLHDVEVFCNLTRSREKPVCYCIVNDVTERNKAERKLLESKTILEAALESMSDAVFISDNEGRFIEINNAFATFHRFGNKKDCLRKLSEYPDLLNVFLTDGTPATLEQWAISRALQGETGVAVEYMLQRKDTGERWIGSYNFAPIRDEHSNITGSVVTGRDITHWKKAEQELRESEERFRNFFEQHSAVMVVLDPDTGRIMDANMAAAEFYGWTKEKLCSMNIFDINTDNPENVRSLLDGWKNAEKRTFIVNHRKSDGTKRLIEEFGQKIKEKEKWLVYCIFHDITERKKAEDELKKLSVAIEQSPAVVVITDPSGNIEYVNPTFTKLTGYTFSEAKGQNPRILKSGLMPQEVYEHLWGTILSGKVWHGELHNKKKNGELYWEDAFISAIRNENGCITNFVAVKEDITEKKKLWNELVASRDKAEESDRLKTAFLNNISHEIRTPMNGILGFSELLREPQLSGEEQQEYIELIQQSGERMMKLINDIMEISRIDARESIIELSETPLNGILDELYNEYRAEAENKGLVLSRKSGLPGNECHMVTDGKKLRMILSNLLQNALKFTSEGHIDFGYEKKDSIIEFYVTDTGVGVPLELKEKIFERFSQVDTSLTKFHEGAGLGLSITKAYIELLGGIIHMEPGLNGGSRFFFTLPWTPLPDPLPIEPVIPETTEIPALNIIIAEDDNVSALLLRKTLKSEQFTLHIASNGMQAVELVRQHPETDLVLMDLKMPVMNGYDATRLIREIRPGLPVIAQTAFASPDDREKALYAGFSGFLTKPVKKSELLGMIMSLAGKK